MKKAGSIMKRLKRLFNDITHVASILQVVSCFNASFALSLLIVQLPWIVPTLIVLSLMSAGLSLLLINLIAIKSMGDFNNNTVTIRTPIDTGDKIISE